MKSGATLAFLANYQAAARSSAKIQQAKMIVNMIHILSPLLGKQIGTIVIYQELTLSLSFVDC